MEAWRRIIQTTDKFVCTGICLLAVDCVILKVEQHGAHM